MSTRRQGASASWTAGDDRLRLLLDGMRDQAVAMIGPQGMVLTWNAGAVRIFGHAAEEIIGQQVATCYPPAAAGAGTPQGHLREALESGRFAAEGWRVRKDGTRFWASVEVTPLRDRSGRLRGFAQVVRDLSDRLRAEDLLAVLDAAPDAIVGVDGAEDGDGRVMFLNHPAARLFGYAPVEIVGRPVELLVPVDVRTRHAHRRDGAAADVAGHAAPDDRLRVEALRRDGTTFPAEVALRSVPTPRGRVVTATVRDLTPEGLTGPAAAPGTLTRPGGTRPPTG